MSKIDYMIKCSKKYIGVKYNKWTFKTDLADDFFCVNSIPKLETLKKNGLVCSSFINILRQHYGSKIPESNSIYRGGTLFWYNYLNEKKVLHKFEENKNYPLGTLLLRKYINETEQGHVAVVCGINKIIHCFYNDKPENGKVDISKINKNYYEYFIYPEDWLE